MTRLICLLGTIALASSACQATVIAANPDGERSILLIGEQYYVVDYLSVMNPTDRAILEYDVSGLDESVLLVTLDISFGNLDYPGLPDGIIDVFTFTGDGVVTASDFYAGGSAPFMSFVGENGPEYGYVSIDVTSAVHDVLAGGGQYIGFRLSTGTTDRFDIGEAIDVPNPILTVIPEPATLVIFAIGGLLLRRSRRAA